MHFAVLYEAPWDFWLPLCPPLSGVTPLITPWVFEEPQFRDVRGLARGRG